MNIFFQKEITNLFDQELLKESIKESSLCHLQIGRGDFRGTLIRSDLGPACIDYGHYNLRILAKGELPDNRYTFGLLFRSPDDTKVYKKILPVWDMIILPPGNELEVFLSEDAHWTCVSFDKDYFESYCRKIAGCCDVTLPKQPCTHPLQGHDINDLSYMLKIILFNKNDLHVGDENFNNFDQLLEDLTLVFAKNLLALQGENITLSLKHNRLQLVNQVVELLIKNNDTFSNFIKMSDICKLFNVSVRTLEYAFKEIYGISPSKFLKSIRLNKARNALLNPTQDKKTVTEIAMYYGFMHLSQFASDYRSCFCELPSYTLMRGYDNQNKNL